MNEFFVQCNENQKTVKVVDDDSVIVGEKEYPISLTTVNTHHFLLRIGNKVFDITKAYTSNSSSILLINGKYFSTSVQSKLEKAASEIMAKQRKQHHHSEINSPMPGMVLKIEKDVGDTVDIGDTVCILEAMKMENDIKSTFSGKITEMFIKEGTPVEKGAPLFRIE